jgi:hypothetical protein
MANGEEEPPPRGPKEKSRPPVDDYDRFGFRKGFDRNRDPLKDWDFRADLGTSGKLPPGES